MMAQLSADMEAFEKEHKRAKTNKSWVKVANLCINITIFVSRVLMFDAVCAAHAAEGTLKALYEAVEFGIDHHEKSKAQLKKGKAGKKCLAKVPKIFKTKPTLWFGSLKTYCSKLKKGESGYLLNQFQDHGVEITKISKFLSEQTDFADFVKVSPILIKAGRNFKEKFDEIGATTGLVDWQQSKQISLMEDMKSGFDVLFTYNQEHLRKIAAQDRHITKLMAQVEMLIDERKGKNAPSTPRTEGKDHKASPNAVSVTDLILDRMSLSDSTKKFLKESLDKARLAQGQGTAEKQQSLEKLNQICFGEREQSAEQFLKRIPTHNHLYLYPGAYPLRWAVVV